MEDRGIGRDKEYSYMRDRLDWRELEGFGLGRARNILPIASTCLVSIS